MVRRLYNNAATRTNRISTIRTSRIYQQQQQQQQQQKYRFIINSSQLFSSSITLGQPEDKQKQQQKQQQPQADNTLDVTSISSSVPSIIEPQQQCWLDLRGTAVNPNEAINFLSELLEVENMEDYIDKIILRSTDVDYDSVTNSLFLCEILLEDENGLLKSLNNNKGTADKEKSAFGTITTLNTEIMNTGLDPLAALDTVSQGQWYIIDAGKYKDDDTQIRNPVNEQIANIVNFLSSASFSSDTNALSSGGLFLSLSSSQPINSGDNAAGITSNNNNIRIGVLCSNQNLLVKVDSIFSECYYSNMMGTTTNRFGFTNTSFK
jgi:hypothetical protein